MRRDRREGDSNGYVPTICEDCDRYGSCEYDPADCEPVPCERAAEEED